MILMLSLCLFPAIIINWEMMVFMFFSLSFLSLMKIFKSFSFELENSLFINDLMSDTLTLLSMWICALMLISNIIANKIHLNNKEFSLLTWMLGMFLFLSFKSYNFILFYISFETVIIPTLLLIVGWGSQPERLQAGIYLIFYTLGASLPLLVAFFYMKWMLNTMTFPYMWMTQKFSIPLLWTLIFILAFLVKLPMFLIHLWLPKAHVEAPIADSMST